MAVVGPNVRNDYHINETEELSYQYKVDEGKLRDICIKEGLLVNTPHNPVCFANTVRIVMKHEQPAQSQGILIDQAFHITDLGTQLKPGIQRWQQNKELRNCKERGTVTPPK
ncbi:hypothetical protein K435DRAFT_824579 [Dendrothele bispora CBS 962.96]|uniref:Uncharacterized protein n=1 Tax=Dendrothele bispora (strain CBS 962.96) TaxID=1314807 RepID=A0A4S8KLG4_DENBC|nr:hypothetical protein K435DRAFT_824579 [Dendrothele bispora CBS 962.96]